MLLLGERSQLLATVRGKKHVTNSGWLCGVWWLYEWVGDISVPVAPAEGCG
jgi:hypothetical protein